MKIIPKFCRSRGHEAQIEGSQRLLTSSPTFGLINFNVSILKNGIQRVVYSDKKTAQPPSAPNQDFTWRAWRLGG